MADPSKYTPISEDVYSSTFIAVCAALAFGGRYTSSDAGDSAIPPIAGAVSQAFDQALNMAEPPQILKQVIATSAAFMAGSGLLLSTKAADYAVQAADAVKIATSGQDWYDANVNS